MRVGPVRPMMQAPVLLLAAATGPAAEVSYTYPPQARAIPPLRAWMDAQAAALRSGVEAEAAADRRDAVKEGRPFNRYESVRTWTVVTDLPQLLSLSLERYDFSGGAHGNTSYAALVYDRHTGARLPPLSFFTSPAAFSEAVRAGFCRQLDAERRRVRGGTLDSTLPEFSKCIDPAGETVILGSSDKRRFDRIGFLIAPYDAGPYSDGAYEVTLPVTPAVLAAVRPEYRAYFAVPGR